jgi:hypothetical protein
MVRAGASAWSWRSLKVNRFHALTDAGLYVQLHVVFELAFRGQVPPFSLNPQPSRHYRASSFAQDGMLGS